MGGWISSHSIQILTIEMAKFSAAEHLFLVFTARRYMHKRGTSRLPVTVCPLQLCSLSKRVYKDIIELFLY